MIKEIKINRCLGKVNGGICNFEYMSYSENAKCPRCGRNDSEKKDVLLIDLNETIKSIEEKVIATSCIDKISKAVYSFNTDVVMNTEEFRKDIREWIKNNKITAALVCYAYSRGSYSVMEHSDDIGFKILLNIPNESLTIPNTNVSINIFEEIDKLEEVGVEYDLIVQDDVYIHSEYLNEDLLLLERSSSSDYNGNYFKEVLSLANYDLVKIIYKEIENAFLE